MTPAIITAAGDSGLLVRLGDEPSAAVADAVHAAWAVLESARTDAPFVVDLVPSYRSVLVSYDGASATEDDARRFVTRALAAPASPATSPPHTHDVPVLYDPSVAPDLEALARDKALSVADLVARHTAPEYRVHMLGFRPGFPFLGGLDPALAAPRLSSPRTAVPAGSIGIGGRQTGIYPVESPGGWRIIGRTPLRIFDPGRAEPFTFAAGDRVRFTAIDERRFVELGGVA